ncbi:DUF1501 domain-containing protein [Tuwongella immobilis]|uniref:DUF1501 domain-containing protein n=1 Tax=Tuwongella immobilis TaxID=692036 RepID=A0A6C2YJK1_9BACT|nr:DUF1501 domain-containing protein [Tuwongella immobilis]VIP01461.1 hypothetical protein : Uncharacterized protein OS=Singulisphaera acidiphila (strain ATCC BAA-1392 / DSM 18658 / VKM B-2454 / MOB10) GN=Sinac_1252 PE=4 SV=1: DUF1501 [Tuwongella immobilis]VTR98475.1 hypothetical protein : Uncharacterized protein OS=Singulisphaera acidiphila (strain ATCC BAA-1392 / DSM 18658 / VKM B-2454 / MOB10) GN=Sinac_1252 PE=4 SV=1: DUF1501 [Tuwongella immobilis]
MPHTHRIGLNRREVLQVGYSALLGVSMANALATPATAAANSSRGKRRPKSVILVFTTGASSHIDTFDPKPNAPAEIRGEFKAIATRTPGMQFTEHVPMLANRSDRFAVVRTLSHKDDNHTGATHHLLTGTKQPGGRFDKPLSRDDWPVYGAGVGFLSPPPAGIPAGVTLPTFLRDGPLVWPGQHGGFLGPKFDPWQVDSDPNQKSFRVGDLRLMDGLDVDTLSNRRSLLQEMNQKQVLLAETVEGRRLNEQQEKAFALLTSGAVARAFEMDREPDKLRDRYGRNLFGQSLLLARRLVQAGVPMIQANMGRVQNWDTHGGNFKRLKGDLLPALDRAVAALLDDLHDSGLLDDTMVIVTGEFGRTPKVNNQDGGRDHWAPCFSAIFAGGGVQGGQVIGKSDASAAYPATVPYTPDDLGATVYEVLGVDPTAEVRDRLNRPVQLNRGEPIRALFTGAIG